MSDRRLRGIVAATVALLAGLSLGLGPRPRTPAVAGTAPVPDQEQTRARALLGLRTGREGEGGLRTGWPAMSGDGLRARNVEFQYATLEHQTDAALAGMWLFLATEALFFGGLFLVYANCRLHSPGAIAAASQHGELAIGTINTVILLTSSAVFVWGLAAIQAGRVRALVHACHATMGLGAAFLVLKAVEWTLDISDGLVPGSQFSIHGAARGPAELFWSFYWIATALHGVHMVVGIMLVAWIVRGARRGRFGAAYHTPVEVVGLYWSFVDMVWLLLYPTIYLAAGTHR